jgi:hypothetical protein
LNGLLRFRISSWSAFRGGFDLLDLDGRFMLRNSWDFFR